MSQNTTDSVNTYLNNVTAMPKQSIQTLDVSGWTGPDTIEQKAFIQDLKKSFTDLGFVIIKGHDVNAELQQRAYKNVDRFFKLPVDVKKAYHRNGTGGERGYTAFGTEHSKDNPVGDLKEFFQYGPTVPNDHPMKSVYCENVSVPEIAGFDETQGELFRKLNALGMDLLRAIAVILEQDENYFTEKVRYGNSKLRAIHYPPLRGDEKPGAVRSAEHEDINLITLLIGASSPGLQVKTRTGEWLPIQTKENEIVVNVGDMLQRLTNYKLKSTTHRVVNPPAELATTNRYSMPFFLHPVSDMSLAALPSCVSPDNPPRDPATTAGEYLNERLRQIGLK
jgi:isopenicillin N synthase-like dioxygenase